MKQASSDLRMSALKCAVDSSGKLYFSQYFQYGACRVQQISPYSNRPVCFTTEAVKYAQSGYFYANFISQLFNNIICKTRRESIFTQGMHNLNMYFGMTTEIIIGLILAYVYPINVVFGSRDNTFLHFGIVAVPVSLIILCIEEIRRYLIRHIPASKTGRPNWFERCTLW
jgi:sodium/potassium-transporting ATPase subunit alpha